MRVLLVFLALRLCSGAALAQEEFRITLIRSHGDADLTYGDLGVNGQNIGLTYERADEHLKPGVYRGLIRYISGRGHVVGPFGTIGQEGDFYLEIGDATFSYGDRGHDVMVHGGFKKEHSNGCIMLGAVPRDSSGNRYLPPDHTLSKLRYLFYGTDDPVASPNKRIVVEIVGN